MLVNFYSDAFLSQSGFLSRQELMYLFENSVDRGAFFFYVLQKRLALVWLMAILSTTFAGIVTTYFFVLWVGACGGIMVSVCIMRYGFRGILLLAGGMMPQFCFYIPAFLLLAGWCFATCVRLYHPVQDYSVSQTEKEEKLKPMGGLLWIHGIVIVGAVLESYVNPGLVAELLKIF